MCGIIGAITQANTGFNMEGAMSAILHRGPDSGAEISYEHNDTKVQLGHRRLSIIDLSDLGNQPMTDGDVTMVYNGEVYNFKEIKTAHLQGQDFKSSSDTEVVLKMYLKFGPSFVEYLNGDFAICILDRRINELLLFRDRMGVKPLYIYQSATHFSFASEIKSFKGAGLPLSLNEDEVGNFFVFKYTPAQRTLFKQVRRLKPGTFLRFNLENKDVEEHTYWSLADVPNKFSGTYAEAKEETRRLVGEAVKKRLVADVPIANYLSGGLDSSIIAHYLKGGNHAQYCAVKSLEDLKKEGTSSDGYYAQKLASDWGLTLEQIPIGLEKLTPDYISAGVEACDDLIADGSIIPAMLIAKQAGQNHKVVLSGMGADELFFGYNGHFLAKLNVAAGKVPGLKSILGPSLQKIDAGKGSFKAYRRYLQKWGNNIGKPYELGRYSVVGDVDSAISVVKGGADLGRVYAPYFDNAQDPFYAMFRFEMDNFLVKNLHYLDRSSMAFGLESRVPFLDHELVEFAASLPVEWKLDWKLKSKKILKEAYAAEIPDYVTKRRKAGFGMPLRALLAKDEVLNTLLPMEFFGDLPYFNGDEINRIIASHKSGAQDQSALIYALISFRAWHQKFL